MDSLTTLLNQAYETFDAQTDNKFADNYIDALVWACSSDCRTTLHRIMKRSPDTTITSDNIETACRRSSVEFVKDIIQYADGTQIDIPRFVETASQVGDLELVQWLTTTYSNVIIDVATCFNVMYGGRYRTFQDTQWFLDTYPGVDTNILFETACNNCDLSMINFLIHHTQDLQISYRYYGKVLYGGRGYLVSKNMISISEYWTQCEYIQQLDVYLYVKPGVYVPHLIAKHVVIELEQAVAGSRKSARK